MFFPGSRYEKTGMYQTTRPGGATVTVARLPKPVQNPLLGYHRRLEGQRLDLIAANYVNDPTAFWKLCDANNSVSPDALSRRPLIGIPVKNG